MLYVANGILKDHSSAEDAVSDAFIKIIKNLNKIGNVECHKTRNFVVTIVRNSAIDIYNKKDRDNVTYDADALEDIPSTAIGLADDLIGLEGYKNIIDIFNSLPESLRDVAELAFIYKYEYKEITELLGISYDTVRKRISRTKAIIKDRLSKLS